MSSLADVQIEMLRLGWIDGGGPGSVKLDDDAKVIGKHGDALWIADMQKAIERVKHREGGE